MRRKAIEGVTTLGAVAAIVAQAIAPSTQQPAIIPPSVGFLDYRDAPESEAIGRLLAETAHAPSMALMGSNSKRSTFIERFSILGPG